MAGGDVTRIGNPSGSWIHTYNAHHIADLNPHWA